MVIEMDIPSLSISIPDKYLREKVNLNDNIFISIEYPKPTDEIFFSTSLYYDYEVVNT